MSPDSFLLILETHQLLTTGVEASLFIAYIIKEVEKFHKIRVIFNLVCFTAMLESTMILRYINFLKYSYYNIFIFCMLMIYFLILLFKEKNLTSIIFKI